MFDKTILTVGKKNGEFDFGISAEIADLGVFRVWRSYNG